MAGRTLEQILAKQIKEKEISSGGRVVVVVVVVV
jgi:hypothetical protein